MFMRINEIPNPNGDGETYFNKKIRLPNGKVLSVVEIVQGLHLDSFLDEYIYE